jgi:murein DD-endopeptidase MepM/ murein hydrolase activator NlpD
VISRYSYMRAIDQQNNQIVATVARLRDETRSTVNQLRAVRDALAAKRDELARTQTTLQGRQASLAAAQSHKQHVLVHVRANGRQLQSDVHSIQARIQAAQAAQAPTVGFGLNSPGAVGSPFPAGIPSSGGAVSPFPASSPLTWGRTDQGVDGETAPGSPILAMGSGTVSIEHDPAGFGDSDPMLSTSFGDFYYGHCIPVVADGTQVRTGQQIAMGHYGTWGNSTTPGGFEIGSWPPGSMVAGGAIRSWLIGLPRILTELRGTRRPLFEIGLLAPGMNTRDDPNRDDPLVADDVAESPAEGDERGGCEGVGRRDGGAAERLSREAACQLPWRGGVP